jgi:hypothetical protein
MRWQNEIPKLQHPSSNHRSGGKLQAPENSLQSRDFQRPRVLADRPRHWNLDDFSGALELGSHIVFYTYENDTELMKTLYLDIFSGISGDMFIGAILDLGVSPHKLARELEKLKLDGFHLHVAQAEKSGIAGIKFDVHLESEHHHDHEHGDGCDHEQEEHSHAPRPTPHDHDHGDHASNRNFRDIKTLITKSKLSPWVKKKSIAVFQRIAEAEGKIHGKPASEVHFHEVGAVDSIVDIVGACIALELLGKPRVLAGTGGGRHGLDSLRARTFSDSRARHAGDFGRAQNSHHPMRRTE